MSQTHTGLGVQLAVCDAEEEVRAVPFFALLGGKGFQDGLHGLDPEIVKDGRISRYLPVVVCQAHRIAVRIYLPLALPHVRVLRGARLVRISVVSRGALVEGVGVRIYVDERKLLADNAGKHLAKMLILLAKIYIGPHLGTGIPQPHSVDVSGIHEGEPGFLVKMDGGINGVGEAVAEHPAQLGIGKLRGHLIYLLLNGLGYKQAVLGSRTLVRIFLCTGTQGQQAQHNANANLFHS